MIQQEGEPPGDIIPYVVDFLRQTGVVVFFEEFMHDLEGYYNPMRGDALDVIVGRSRREKGLAYCLSKSFVQWDWNPDNVLQQGIKMDK